jgi:hypothetical protein
MLPRFTYHPDPLATGSIVRTELSCACCGKARGFVYALAPYGEASGLVGRICPWCIADGSAARKFDATFVSRIEDGLEPAVRDEILTRTPGYASWQGELWLGHCGDACEYHGDPSAAQLANLSDAEIAGFLNENPLIEDWPTFRESYDVARYPALYRFVCRHCGTTRLGMDFS